MRKTQIFMTPRHRHFLALPLFIFSLVAIATAGGAMTASAVMTGSVVSNDVVSVADDTPFTFADLPAAGFLSDGGLAHEAQGRLWLEDGAMLVTTPSMVVVRAGDMEFTTVQGGFLLIKGSKVVTIMALTAPVLVRNEQYRFVVPTGYQGEWSAAELPTIQTLATVADQLTTLTTILPETRVQQLAKLTSIAPLELPAFASSADDVWPSFLTLEKSADRQAAADTLEAFSQLRSAIAMGDLGGARELLGQPLVQNALKNVPDESMLRTLVILAQTMPSIERDLISYVHDADFWLLLSLHPRFSLAAWETDGPVEAPLSVRTQRFLQFPSSDVAEAHANGAVERWKKQLASYLQGANDAPGFVSLLLKSMRSYKDFAAANNLPERLLRYAEAIRELSGPYAADLSEEDRALIDAWTAEEVLPEYQDAPALSDTLIPEVAPPVEAPPAVEPVPVAEPVSGADARAQEAEAKALLQTAGGLFAVTTKFHADVRGSVDIEGIIFASESGDHSYDFTLDLVAKRVTEIRVDGQTMPFPMALDAFANWARTK
jgi:hypothetical protein